MRLEPGLCGNCRWARIIETARASRFYLCGRSRIDPRFPRYPRLPVVRCAGYEPEIGTRCEPRPEPDT